MNSYVYETLDIKEINSTIDKCDICIFGMSENNIPYLIPVYFIYDKEERKFYLESKAFGKKMRYLNNNPNVTIYIQYDNSNLYKTVVAQGVVTITDAPIDCSTSNMVSVVVLVKEISGRLYKK